MDIEDLNKAQIVLLVLLVSFVTSIATGIVTVSLVAQAPPAVTQTINRIVERTVETVVPQEGQGAAAVVTKETTVVVKEDDLMSDSIQASFARVGKIRGGVATSSPVVGLGVLVTGGLVVTDLSVVEKEHLISFPAGDFVYTVAGTHASIGIAILTPKDGRPETTGFRAGDTSSLKLGQTSIALFGTKTDRVNISSFSAFLPLAEVMRGEEKIAVRLIDTTPEAVLTPGAPLITIFGDLVGVSTNAARTAGSKSAFVSYSDIVSLVSAARPAATSSAQQ